MVYPKQYFKARWALQILRNNEQEQAMIPTLPTLHASPFYKRIATQVKKHGTESTDGNVMVNNLKE